jgi:hypothetical protein
MMIFANIRKSKQKLKPKKEREQYEQWLSKHQAAYTPKVSKRQPLVYNREPLVYSLPTPVGRTNTKHIPSRDTGLSVAPARIRNVYTGDKMIGIGTLHKSNAVPVFSNEEAQDMARMRR